MPLELGTVRPTLRPWTGPGIDARRALVAERGGGMPSAEDGGELVWLTRSLP
ncbi:hypothetical protein [Streptomyces sp. NPDC056628]|uniref:hypothetical protein n=1 Tax=Streptomyces sp. NPDC056628 TaxID=3345882 RepID=UPI0036740413